MKNQIVSDAQNAVCLAQSQEATCLNSYRASIIVTESAKSSLQVALALPEDSVVEDPVTTYTIVSNINATISSQDGQVTYSVSPEAPASVPAGNYYWSGENGSYIASGFGYISAAGELRANGEMLDYITQV